LFFLLHQCLSNEPETCDVPQKARALAATPCLVENEKEKEGQ
jgi:hypothetical protein